MALIEQIKNHKNKAVATTVLALLVSLGLYNGETEPPVSEPTELSCPAMQEEMAKNVALGDAAFKKGDSAAVEEIKATNNALARKYSAICVTQVDAPLPVPEAPSELGYDPEIISCANQATRPEKIACRAAKGIGVNQ